MTIENTEAVIQSAIRNPQSAMGVPHSAFEWMRALSIARKEVRHIRRDPLTLAMALGLPFLMVMFFGLVISFDVHHIRLAVVDRDQSRESRELLRTFSSAEYFDLVSVNEGADPLRLLDAERAKAVLVIERGFAKDVGRFGKARVQIAVDGADNQTAGIIGGYLAGIERAASEALTGRRARPPLELRTRFIFNPELNSRWFIVPGLIVVVIGILSILLTALTVAREWENGSMELLLSTPVRPLEIIVGKLLPYTVLGLGAMAFVYLCARFAFGVPFRGSHVLFLAAGLLFLATTLAQGLVISVVTRQQQLAMQLANITGMLPSIMLSGFIFPVSNMPVFFQYLTSILAQRWFMTIIRGVFLRGAGVWDLAGPFAVLAGIAAALLALAAKSFKTDLEP